MKTKKIIKMKSIAFIVWSNGWHKIGIVKMVNKMKIHFDNEIVDKFLESPINFLNFDNFDKMDKNSDEYRKLEYEYKQWKTNEMITKINGDF